MKNNAILTTFMLFADASTTSSIEATAWSRHSQGADERRPFGKIGKQGECQCVLRCYCICNAIRKGMQFLKTNRST